MRSASVLAWAAASLVALSGCGSDYDLDPSGADVGGAGSQAQTPSAPSPEETQQTSSNLRQLAVAMHTYHDRYPGFPPAATRDDDGNPLLSWRVHILEFIGQGGLHQQFRLDEPWDSPHNSQFLERMPKEYVSRGCQPGTTSVMVFTGEGAPFGGDKPPRLRDITDGTSNTILLVEAGADKAVPWTKPEDLPLESEDPVAALGELVGDRFVAAFIDGAVRGIPKDIDPKSLRAFITNRGGELIFPDSIR